MKHVEAYLESVVLPDTVVSLIGDKPVSTESSVTNTLSSADGMNSQ